MYPTKLVVSSRNRHKLDEIHAIMAGLPLSLLSLDAFPNAPEVIEDQPNLEGNAAKKSNQLFEFTGLPTMSDDTGLEVTSLGGAPGVYSARYAGETSTDQQNRELLLKNLSDHKERRAQFRTVIAFTTNSGTFLFEGVCPGQIALTESGANGFGYDSVFIPDGFETSFAEMDAAAKNSISHRARALSKFASHLRDILVLDS